MPTLLRVILVVLVVLFKAAALSAQGAYDSSGTSSTNAATFDLRQTDFTRTKDTHLNAEWDFFYGKLYTPLDLRAANSTPVKVAVPGDWTSYDAKTLTSGKFDAFDPEGCATYRIKLLMPTKYEALGLQVPYVWSAYKVYVNGKLEAQRGSLACDPAVIQPLMVKSLIQLPNNQAEIEIVVQVASRSTTVSGLIEPWVAGSYQHLLADREFYGALYLTLVGALFIMAFYHILIYLLRRKERFMLFFGFICLTVTLRFLTFGDHYIYEWLLLHSGFFHFDIQVRVYFLSSLLLVVLGFAFIHALYPKDLWARSASVMGGLVGAYTLFAVSVSTHIFALTFPVITILLILGGTYLAYGIVRAAWFNRPRARLLAVGMGIMLLAAVHDGLQTVGISLISETEILTLGFVGFLFVQFYVVSSRYATAFNELEDLTEHLEEKVTLRTKELSEANEIITEKNQDITDSISYARRIQLSILPETKTFFEQFPDAFILYRPKDIVSGDYYWMHKTKDYFYVCAADCTGHGVPGAFMSVLGSGILNQLVRDLDQPNSQQLLSQMNQRVRVALKQDERKGEERKPVVINEDGEVVESQDGMDLALIRLDLKKQEVCYSGANRALLLVRAGVLTEYSPTKHPIGGGADLYEEKVEFQNQLVSVQKGDTLYMFTDGITDQFGGEKNRKFSSKRFRDLVVEVSALPMVAQKARLEKELNAWQHGRSQTDDILVMGIRV